MKRTVTRAEVIAEGIVRTVAYDALYSVEAYAKFVEVHGVEHDGVCRALDPAFEQKRKRYVALQKQIQQLLPREAQRLFSELCDLSVAQACIERDAAYLVGVAAGSAR